MDNRVKRQERISRRIMPNIEENNHIRFDKQNISNRITFFQKIKNSFRMLEEPVHKMITNDT
jgi:hypothetical protein